ncbi:MAG: DUF4250 domain-containing protein [Fusobacteriaceae bacterium]|jgi:hypothetical protein|nr:DUF4250 domain-containing protein [Fusobacteriaceae bacterium]
MENDYTKMEIAVAYSIINLKLRDYYSSFEEFCERENQKEIELRKYLDSMGYYYNDDLNQLRKK